MQFSLREEQTVLRPHPTDHTFVDGRRGGGGGGGGT